MSSRPITTAAFSLMLAWTCTAQAADDRPWTVGKSSGEVWIATPGVQQASLTAQAALNPGDTIRTGRTGRVLLVRGEESIMIAPNSSIGVPQHAGDGLSTTIVQQAGSILLEVEKRNVKHFEVETPYLAAVVKGTRFRVSVDASGTHVDVLRGQVEVADFKSGQIAQIMPGQSAASFGQGKPGLSLTGSGSFAAIAQGQPRPAPVERLPVPRTGLGAPRNAGGGMHVLNIGENKGAAAAARATTVTAASLPTTTSTPIGPGAHHAMRIAAPIGDVRLNFTKVTNGLARGAGTTVATAGRGGQGTIWSGQDGKTGITAQGNNAGQSNGSTNAAASVAASGSVIAPSVVAAAVAASGADTGSGSSATSGAAMSSGSSGAMSSGNSGASAGNGNGGSASLLAALAAALRAEVGRGNNGNGNGNGNAYAYGRR